MEENTVFCHNHRNCNLGCSTWTELGFMYEMAKIKYKACQSESGTEVEALLFPAVELCDFSGRWQCMSGEIWYTPMYHSSIYNIYVHLN
jgi:hypothetical protein